VKYLVGKNLDLNIVSTVHSAVAGMKDEDKTTLPEGIIRFN